MKQKLGKKLKDLKNLEIQLLIQDYSRYVSRAHTVFSSTIEAIFALISVTIGIVFSLVQIEAIPWNKFYFVQVILIDVLICLIVFLGAFAVIYDSRKQRINIANKVRLIGAT